MPTLTDVILGRVEKEPDAWDTAGELWRSTLGKGFGRTVEGVADWVEGDPSQQGIFEQAARQAISETMFRPTQRAVEGIGGVIGGAAGALGGAFSEAATDDGGLKAIFEGMKGGASEGAEQAKDVVENVDVLGLGAGVGANLLTKAATTLKSASAASSALKGARIANMADFGLSAADAAYGGLTLREAVEEDDWGKGFEGVARIAGNALGLTFAAKDLKALSRAEPVINAYKRFEATRGPDDYDAYLQEVRAQHPVIKANEPGSPESLEAIRAQAQAQRIAENESLLADPSITPNETFLNLPNKTTANVDQVSRSLQAAGRPLKAIRKLKTDSGNEYFLIRNALETSPWKPYADRVAKDLIEDGDTVKTLNWLAETADNVSQRIGNRMADEATIAGGVGPLEVQHGMGRFGGYVLDPSDEAGAFVISFEHRQLPKLKAMAEGNRYYVNLPTIANVNKAYSGVVLSPVGQRNADNVLRLFPDYAQDIIKKAWSGTEISARERALIDNIMFVRNLTYSMIHEAAGHSVAGSGHIGGKGYAEIDNLPLTPGVVRNRFDELNQIIVKYQTDPNVADTALEAAIADARHMAAGSRIDKIRRSLYSDPQVDRKSPFRMDRPMGTKKSQEPDIEFVQEMKDGAKQAGEEIRELEESMFDVPIEDDPTVPRPPGGGGPPGGSGGGTGGRRPAGDYPEPIGPKLEDALHTRIKKGLSRQKQFRPEQAKRNAEITAMQGKQLQELRKKFTDGEITLEEFKAQQHDIMSQTSKLKGSQELAVPMSEGELEQLYKETIFKDIAVEFGESEDFIRVQIQNALTGLARGDRLEPNQVKVLERYFLTPRERPEFDLLHRFMRGIRDAIGFSRAVMTSADLSGSARQGLFASVMNPKEATKAFGEQLKAFFGTEEQFKIFMDKLQNPRYNPYLELQKAAGLHFSHEYKEGGEAVAEEMFQFAKYAQKVPLVRRSERAYIAYLNKMRVELFNKMTDKMLLDQSQGGLGMNMIDDFQAFKDLAYTVNTLTGRGELSLMHISPDAPLLGKKTGLKEELKWGGSQLEKAHQLLTTGLFAPRFMASRGAMLRDMTLAFAGGNLHPTVYKEYMRNVMGTVGVLTTVMSSLAALGLGTVEWNPKKHDFGVLKIGNARYDPWGGLKQWVKLHVMLASDEYYTSTGNRRRFGEFAAQSKTDVLTRFMLTKGSPATSLVLEILTGESPIGKKRPWYKAAAERVTPMVAQNLYEIYEEEGAEQMALSAPFVIVGGNVAAYNPWEMVSRKKRIPRRRRRSR